MHHCLIQHLERHHCMKTTIVKYCYLTFFGSTFWIPHFRILQVLWNNSSSSKSLARGQHETAIGSKLIAPKKELPWWPILYLFPIFPMENGDPTFRCFIATSRICWDTTRTGWVPWHPRVGFFPVGLDRFEKGNQRVGSVPWWIKPILCQQNREDHLNYIYISYICIIAIQIWMSCEA